MRAGPGTVASSASRCRSTGASCRLPPSLTTHIASSQIRPIGPTAGSPCSIGSSSFSGHGTLADGRGQRDAGLPSPTAGSILARCRRRACSATAGRRRPYPRPGRRVDRPGSRPITGEEELARMEPVVRAMAHEATSRSTPTTPPPRHAASSWVPASSTTSRLARRPRDGRRGARPRAGAGHDARQGRPAAARDRPAGALRRRGPRGRRLARGRVDAALAAGIDADQIVLDPGWGKFLSLEPAHSWEMLARFDELVARLPPIPVVIGISRKGLLRRAHGRARSALAAHQPRGPAKGPR